MSLKAPFQPFAPFTPFKQSLPDSIMEVYSMGHRFDSGIGSQGSGVRGRTNETGGYPVSCSASHMASFEYNGPPRLTRAHQLQDGSTCDHTKKAGGCPAPGSGHVKPSPIKV